MYKKLSLLALLVLLSGCGGSKPKAPVEAATVAPVSREATFIESQSSNEVLISAFGKGPTMDSAMNDARLAALWFVLEGGNNPMLQTPKERQAFEMYAQDFYKNVGKYIAFESKLKSKQMEGSTYKVARNFRLNTGMLREDLEQKGLLASVETLSDALGTISVAVIPKDPELWNDTHYLAAVDVVGEYLQDRNFEVTVIKAAQQTNKIINKAAALSGVTDPMYALAMQTGSDIYIRVNLDKTARMVAGSEVKKASVTMAAFYTATAKQLGASTGYSPERVVSSYASITQEATNDATEKVLGQIQKSWKKESEQGKYFKVIITAAEGMPNIDRSVYNAMKSSCEKIKRNGAGSNMFDYTLQCKKVGDIMELIEKIESNYEGPGKVFREMDAGSLLVLKIANSADDDIMID